ncbi:MAG: hypothetical protein ACTHVM_07130 [Alkalibacterium gilvum]|nr:MULTISPECIES: hypothetical protein [Alkalibacterium]MDN6294230.1 hypothetical protein [Alkalibacterium sp.]MDN6295960.1 hypothetical protein [Alkalibacterium sp.]MDN6397743.1 hypothetical protein [Alkalibacterium sp.]MDN6730054.1 hypothetical protein [Alkalibacterium sp.]
MDDLMIEFYKSKDEQEFIERWEKKNGSLNEEQMDELYAGIAEAIDAAIKSDQHKLGETFVYEGVPVGRSDFNTFYSLYIFEAPRD